ncbi:hypothetical protein GCM10028784_35710 [Myceligenerans cantabricum]
MKQATEKMTLKSTARNQVKRVVATIALATAAGTAAAPAFASDCEPERNSDGFGRAFGSDGGPGAEFGGAERGVEVTKDGTVKVLTDGVLGGAGETVSGVVGEATDVVDGVTDVVDDAVEEPTGVVEGATEVVDDTTDVVDEATGPVEDVVDETAEDVVDDVEDATGTDLPGSSGKGDTPERSEGQGSGKEKGDSRGQGADKGDEQEPGAGEEAGAGESTKGTGYFASLDIDYGTRPAEQATTPASEDGTPVNGELLAFESTAKALGFDRESALEGYEPRHLKTASRSGERVALGERKVAEGVGAALSAGGELLRGVGLGVSASEEGLRLNVGAANVQADVEADTTGVSVEAEVPGAAGADVEATVAGVGASAGAADTARVDAQVNAQNGVSADVDTVAPSTKADGSGPLGRTVPRATTPQETMVADSGAQAYLGKHARDALSAAEQAEALPAAERRAVDDAEAVTQDATVDAPLRVATTGTEAAALTGLAGALVVGGAGALLLANRAGRNGELGAARVPNASS